MSDDDFDGVDRSPTGWEEIGQLNAGQYWRLEAHQGYVDIAKLESKVKNLMHSLLLKDKQLMEVKINKLQQEAITAQQAVQTRKDGYKQVKEAIEKEVGIEFKDVVIDDATYAIRREIDDKIEGGEDSK